MEFLHKPLQLLKHFVFPQACPVCGNLSVAYCDGCLESVAEKYPPFCSECGGWWEESKCENAFPCHFASLYGGYAKDFLLNLKYKNCRSLGIPMGRLMGRLFPKCEADMVLPIPLHKESTRFFNQSELLSQGIAEIWKIPVKAELFWTKNCGRQVEKHAGERKSLPLSAMGCNMLAGKTVMLVDDVYTTGSTIRAAAAAVKQAGGKVCAACFWCKTQRRGDSLEFDDVADALSLEIG